MTKQCQNMLNCNQVFLYFLSFFSFFFRKVEISYLSVYVCILGLPLSRKIRHHPVFENKTLRPVLNLYGTLFVPIFSNALLVCHTNVNTEFDINKEQENSVA